LGVKPVHYVVDPLLEGHAWVDLHNGPLDYANVIFIFPVLYGHKVFS